MKKIFKIKSLQICLGALIGVASPVAFAHEKEAAKKSAASAEFGATDGLMWGLVATEALFYGLDLFDAWPIGRPLMGPTFDLQRPEVDVLLSDDLTPVIGHAYQEESVPTSWVIYGAVGTLAGLNGLQAALGHRHWRDYHDISLGLAASVFTTVTLTEVLKRGVGRLRPDFRDRFVARGCQGALSGVEPKDLPCETVPESLKHISEKEYDYGRRSFPSGHASSSFAIGTFAAHYFWHLGHSFQTQDNTTGALLSWSAGVGALGLAGAVAGTRILDNRHHWSDVLVGSALGASMASLFYTLLVQQRMSGNSRLNLGVHMMANDSPLFSMRMQW